MKDCIDRDAVQRDLEDDFILSARQLVEDHGFTFQQLAEKLGVVVSTGKPTGAR